MPQIEKIVKRFSTIGLAVLIATFAVAAFVDAATAIGNDVTTTGNLYASSTVQATGAITSYGSLNVTGVSNLTSAVAASNTLQVTGAVTHYGPVTNSSAVTNSGIMTTLGLAQFSGALQASSTALFSNGLTTYSTIISGANITVPASYGLDVATAGILNIGTSNANAITVGKSGVTTTDAGALVVNGQTTLANASSTLFSSYGPAYFGATATSSFGTNGQLTLVSSTSVVLATNGSGLVGSALGTGYSWTALQQFNGQASTTMFSSYGPSYFGATATSSFSSAGALTLVTPLAVTSGGTGVTSSTGTGNTVLSASPTFTGTAILAGATLSGLGTFANGYLSQASSTVVGNMTVTGTLSANGTNVPTIQTGTTASLGGGALVAGQCTSNATSGFTGLSSSTVVTLTPSQYPGDGALWLGFVLNSTTVTAKVCAAVAFTPTASTYNIRAIQ